MNARERKSMHLLKQLFDAYNDLPHKLKMEMLNGNLEDKICEIPSVLRLFKEDIGKEISTGVEVSRINQRFPYDEESGEIIVI